MNQDLYIVEYPGKSPYGEACPIPVGYDYSRFTACPQCGERVSGAYWTRPREVVLTKRNPPDFLYAYCDDAPFVISETALERIRAAGLTGIVLAEEIEQVRFQRKGKKEVPLPRYYHIELARSSITVDHENSVIRYGSIRRPHTCPLCRQIPYTYDFTRRLAFHMDAYEGWDIFHCYELGNYVFLSQRFVDFYRDSGLTNLNFVPAAIHGRQEAAYFLDGIDEPSE